MLLRSGKTRVTSASILQRRAGKVEASQSCRVSKRCQLMICLLMWPLSPFEGSIHGPGLHPFPFQSAPRREPFYLHPPVLPVGASLHLPKLFTAISPATPHSSPPGCRSPAADGWFHGPARNLQSPPETHCSRFLLRGTGGEESPLPPSPAPVQI